MKKNIQFIAVILALAAFAASCNKIEDKTSGDNLISFAPQAIGTKAMINNVTGLQSQSFAVKDIVDGALYVENVIQYDNGWAYTSPANAKYLWKNGSHKLFGYTNGMGTFSGTTLTVTERTLTTASPQDDLLYSDIVSTTADAWKAANGKGDPVPLHFHHLFAALSITVENLSPAEVTVNSATVSLPNKGTATISFSGTTPAVTVGTLTKGDFITNASNNLAIVLASKDSLDVLAQAKLATKAKPAQFMVWPQTLAAASATVGAQIMLSYVQGGVNKTATVKIPANTVWEAGKVYAYNLQIRPTEVTLSFHVEDWQVVELDEISSATGSINMSNVMWVNKNVNVGTTAAPVYKNTVDNSGYGTVYLLKKADGTYEDAVGFFTVNYPTSGTYQIVLMPAYGGTEADLQYFEVTPSDEKELPHDSLQNPQTIYFTIKAKNPGTEKHVAQINIYITPTGGVKTSAYSEIRANYTLTINNDPE